MPADPLPRRARYERGAARVFSPDGEPVGAGFLVDEGLLCTCAHVVAEPDGGPPTGPVEVDFPLLSGAVPGPRVTADVESWRPEDDVALLRLKAPVDGAEPLPTADGSTSRGLGRCTPRGRLTLLSEITNVPGGCMKLIAS